MAFTIKILSYNIHKGFNSLGSKLVLKKIRQSIRATNADLVCLQEVVGDHKAHRTTGGEWPDSNQFEYLADQSWPHFSYGKNAVYTAGHHGNAILSKFPIINYENKNITTYRWEQRGLLYSEIKLPGEKKSLHVFCTHLDLLAHNRKKQIQQICKRIDTLRPSGAPFVLAGDFNDWNQSLGTILEKELGTQEAFRRLYGQYALSFPSWWPILRMDRIYFGNLKLISAQVLRHQSWSKLSDHLPIIAEFENI